MSEAFIYSKLEDLLKKFKENNIKNIELELGISFETPYYNGDKFNKLCKDIKRKFLNSNYYSYDNYKFKIDKFTILFADSTNTHNVYYKEILKYLKENSLKCEEDVPLDIKVKIKEGLYKKSKQNGMYWLHENLHSINELMPDDRKLPKTLEIPNDISILYVGDKNLPRIELKSYDYYLHHPEYQATFTGLKEVCGLKNSIIERAFQNELNYFIKRIENRGQSVELEDLLRQQSYNYLFDETVSFIIKHREQHNIIELYYGGSEIMPTEALKGKKAKKDPAIQKYLQGPLKGADQRKFVSVKMVEE